MSKKNKNKIYILLVVAVALIGFLGYWYWQKNFYSKDILKLEILGQDATDFAKEIEYVVKYKNNGTVRLETAKLIFEYPKYAVVPDNKPLWQEILLEDIYPGEEKTISFKARLFGQEGEIKTAKAAISYKPKNLKARYESQTTFTTQIKFLPLTFEFDLPSKIETGKNFQFRLNYFSNTDYPLPDLRIIAQYPAGFEFISSKPLSLEKSEWEIPTLNKADGGRVEISGKMQGEVGEQKIFDAKLGIWRDGEFILLKEITRSVAVVRPALRITQQINGASDYVANPGEQLHYEIFFKNIGVEALNNLTLISTLDGGIFDFESLKATNGDFTLGDNSIVWEWKRVQALQFLDPQEENKVEFWINLKSDYEIPSLEGKLTVKNNIYLNQAKEELVTKVNSKLVIGQKGFFQDEIFGNTGPIPPRVGQTTTYTINWQAKNYYNEVKNAKVKVVLPQNVHLTGKIFPEGSRLTFDSISREIVWEVGDLQVGQGVLNPAPNISFQVALTPEGSQAGQTPEILGQARITGEDIWTGNVVGMALPSLKTDLPDDRSINGQGIVQY